MLNSLSYSATFATTGRTLSGQFRFQKGFGVITGPNESGKSFLIEMIRYAFFGSAALRGVGDDYESLQVEMSWGDYTVKRNPSRATLFRGDDQIAVGTRSVNEKIVKTLGFGLDVFDAACVANQGQLEQLGQMKPADRKRMVDSVIGLGAIEKLEKWAGEEGNVLGREADAIAGTLRQPVTPLPPADYFPSISLKPALAELVTLKSELDQLDGWLSAPRRKPEAPAKPHNRSREDLEALAELGDELKAKRKELARLPAPPAPVDAAAVEAEIEAFERWQETQAFLRAHPRPTMTAEHLATAYSEIHLYDRFMEAIHAKTRLGELIDKGSHTCPACSHSWPVEATAVAEAEAEVSRLVAALEGAECPDVRPNEAELNRQQRLLSDWDAHSASFPNAVEVSKPSMTRTQLAQLRASLALQEQRGPLEARIKVLEALPGIEIARAQLLELTVYEAALSRFETESAAYEAWAAGAAVKRARADELRPKVAGIAALAVQVEEAVAFEAALGVWEVEKIRHAEGVAKVEGLRAEAAGWKAAKASMSLLRSLVKQHLVPSLNKVASSLLRQMTGGQRQTVVVTEDFDITVDGQRLSTLSGSGQAVANLAIRIGLGQVLTNNVLSLFIGDEIDASLDQDRAENTSLCLRNAAERISQLILVTHKSVAADWAIQLTAGRQSVGQEQHSGRSNP